QIATGETLQSRPVRTQTGQAHVGIPTWCREVEDQIRGVFDAFHRIQFLSLPYPAHHRLATEWIAPLQECRRQFGTYPVAITRGDDARGVPADEIEPDRGIVVEFLGERAGSFPIDAAKAHPRLDGSGQAPVGQ